MSDLPAKIPTNRRRRGRREVTEHDLCVFLDVLEKCANPEVAAARAGISMSAVQWHRRANPRFAASYDDLADELVGALESEAYMRSLDRDDPASSKLLMFMLTSLKPDVYGTKVTVKGMDAMAQEEMARVQAAAIEDPESFERMAAQMAAALEAQSADADD
jgi:hypothetical protein